MHPLDLSKTNNRFWYMRRCQDDVIIQLDPWTGNNKMQLHLKTLIRFLLRLNWNGIRFMSGRNWSVCIYIPYILMAFYCSSTKYPLFHFQSKTSTGIIHIHMYILLSSDMAFKLIFVWRKLQLGNCNLINTFFYQTPTN